MLTHQQMCEAQWSTIPAALCSALLTIHKAAVQIEGCEPRRQQATACARSNRSSRQG